MSTETIQAGNRLIAEFMGAVVNPKWTDEITYTYKKDNAPTEHSCYNWGLQEMRYTIEWDWLMRVVQKIEKYCRVEISTPQICIWYKYEDELKSKDGFYCSIPTHGKEKIMVLFTAIVQFITWYNSTTELSKPKQ